ncbi:hypothetical protein BU16DRAFT_525535, partial [Lophium mytilinum]
MSAYINVTLQGTVYFASRSTEDDNMIRLFSRMLVGVAKVSTFLVLYNEVSHDWHQQDDVVNPFLDGRCSRVGTVWTFDLDADVLRFDKKDYNRSVPLSLVRQRAITVSDFAPYEPPDIPQYAFRSILVRRSWKMTRRDLDLQLLNRQKSFVGRLLADFAYQWRHILSARYNSRTFQRLACAIIKIATLDFDVKEVPLTRQGIGSSPVWIHNLPEWKPLSGEIVRVDGASIVICHQVPHAITLMRDDFAKRSLSPVNQDSARAAKRSLWPADGDSAGASDRNFTYLLVSVQEVILCRINSDSERCSKTGRLFDGTNPPSEEAIDLILQATQKSLPATPIRYLPVELQDMILDRVSASPIESARIGCILNIGSDFAWKCGGRDIERVDGRETSTALLESHIRLGNRCSGIAY